MTGFGVASSEDDGVHYAVELRSLNNRYYKSMIRTPDEIAGLEAELDSFLRKRITRGSVTVNVSMRDQSAAAAYHVNPEALQYYLDAVKQTDLGSAQVELGSILALPGVIQPPQSSQVIDRARPAVLKLLGEACDKLTEMRQQEGRGLAEELMRHRGEIARRISGVAEKAPQVVEEYHMRLRNRIDELMARAQLKANEVDLIKEVSVYAERCDVAEEVQRIMAHLDQFEQIVHREDSEPAGRTLDFLAQELLREANTIASKSNDATISRTIVEVKGLIDRIKEQVQNVE